MEIAFGILLLLLIILGLRNRKKEKKTWVESERFEESGDWIDKRSGERGTYGSLDDEMEANRKFIVRQGKISELSLAIQTTLFNQSADYQNFNDTQLKQHLAFCKSEFTGLFDLIDAWISGRSPLMAVSHFAPDPILDILKKQVLDFCFERYPKLLDLDIEQIKRFDEAAAQVAGKILGEIQRLTIR